MDRISKNKRNDSAPNAGLEGENKELRVRLNKAELMLSDSEERLARLTQAQVQVFWSLDLKPEPTLTISPGFESIVDDIDRQKADPRPWLASVHPDDRDNVRKQFTQCIAGKIGRISVECRFIKPDGRIHWIEARGSVAAQENGRPQRLTGTAQDITVCKQAENEKRITLEFLAILSSTSDRPALIQAATAFFKKQTDCDAVGVRLHEAEDYPYFEGDGFSKEFMVAESHLCSRDPDGHLLRDCNGDAILTCFCGSVLHRQCVFSHGSTTSNGTFWTNNLPKCATALSDTERKLIRGGCVRAGYHSVALIPLGFGDRPLGLLQLNSLRKDQFTAEAIGFWERLADKLVFALEKINAEETVRWTHNTLEEQIQQRSAELLAETTKRRACQAVLRRAHRTLRVVKECDEAMVRADSEPELLNRVCRVMLELDGVGMVWVGFADQDEKKPLDPVAWAGDGAEEYLSNARALWVNPESGQSMTETAIRAHKVIACDVADSDPGMAPWREQQLKVGYVASVALPLEWQERCLGALTLYSSRSDAFNDAEIDLLRQLVGDLTFGIVALRTRAEREQLQRELLEISERKE